MPKYPVCGDCCVGPMTPPSICRAVGPWLRGLWVARWRGLRWELGWEGLVKLQRVGGGDYARFWKYISPVFIGGLAIFGCLGGLTGFGSLRGRRELVEVGIETGGGVGPGLKPDLWDGFSGGGNPCSSGRTGKGKGKGRSRFPEGMTARTARARAKANRGILRCARG